MKKTRWIQILSVFFAILFCTGCNHSKSDPVQPEILYQASDRTSAYAFYFEKTEYKSTGIEIFGMNMDVPELHCGLLDSDLTLQYKLCSKDKAYERRDKKLDAAEKAIENYVATDTELERGYSVKASLVYENVVYILVDYTVKEKDYDQPENLNYCLFRYTDSAILPEKLLLPSEQLEKAPADGSFQLLAGYDEGICVAGNYWFDRDSLASIEAPLTLTLPLTEKQIKAYLQDCDNDTVANLAHNLTQVYYSDVVGDVYYVAFRCTVPDGWQFYIAEIANDGSVQMIVRLTGLGDVNHIKLIETTDHEYRDINR